MWSALLLLTSALTLGASDQLRLQFPVSPQDQAIVRDAFGRWAKKTGMRDAERGRVPIVIELPKEKCVLLHLMVPAVGGSPTYCYDYKTSAFIEGKDDVE